jgi:hypothetical protein
MPRRREATRDSLCIDRARNYREHTTGHERAQRNGSDRRRRSAVNHLARRGPGKSHTRRPVPVPFSRNLLFLIRIYIGARTSGRGGCAPCSKHARKPSSESQGARAKDCNIHPCRRFQPLRESSDLRRADRKRIAGPCRTSPCIQTSQDPMTGTARSSANIR